MERRSFFTSLFAFIPLTLSFLGLTAVAGRFLTPTKGKKGLRKVFASALSDIGVNESKPFTDLRGKELLLIRSGENEVKAMSTKCTHLGCKVYWQKDKNQFYCPCHAGIFNADGEVTAGPPPSSLETYPIEVQGNNVFIYLKEKEA